MKIVSLIILNILYGHCNDNNFLLVEAIPPCIIFSYIELSFLEIALLINITASLRTMREKGVQAMPLQGIIRHLSQ